MQCFWESLGYIWFGKLPHFVSHSVFQIPVCSVHSVKVSHVLRLTTDRDYCDPCVQVHTRADCISWLELKLSDYSISGDIIEALIAHSEVWVTKACGGLFICGGVVRLTFITAVTLELKLLIPSNSLLPTYSHYSNACSHLILYWSRRRPLEYEVDGPVCKAGLGRCRTHFSCGSLKH